MTDRHEARWAFTILVVMLFALALWAVGCSCGTRPAHVVVTDPTANQFALAMYPA